MSTAIPGPIVEDTAIFLRYLPLLVAGFALIIELITVLAFSRSFSVSKETYPIGT